MKMNRLLWFAREKGKTLVSFGNARLVKKPNGRIELIGGSTDDRYAAREWCSPFFHEAVFPRAA